MINIMGRKIMFYHKFEAIPSWYCYEYQGILSIYYAIHEINRLINNKEPSLDINDIYKTLEGYSIELEYMEDFSIKFNDKYISFHQVKSGEGALKEIDVRDTYLKLLEEYMNENTNVVGYFHVNKDGKLSDVKKVLDNNIKEYFIDLKRDLLSLENEGLGDKKGKKGSGIQILRAYMKENKSINQADSVTNLCTKIDMIIDDYFNEDNKYKNIFVKLKEYPKSFFNISSIEDEILNELRLCHIALNKETFKINNDYLEKERCKIGCIINDHIDKREHDKKFHKEILLKSFVDIMLIDLNEWGTSNEYYEFKYKEKLYEFYKSYKTEYIEDECLECNKGDCKLLNQLKKIESLSQSQMNVFLDNISILKRNDYNDFPSKDAINQTIFSCMCENKKIGIEEKYNVGVNYKNNDYWILATLANKRNTFLQQLFDEENNNKNILRDADILITPYIDIDNIYDNKYYQVKKEEIDKSLKNEKYDEVDNYNKIRVSSVKKWDDIKGELE